MLESCGCGLYTSAAYTQVFTVCLGHVPATFSCVTSHAKTYTNDFPCVTGIPSGRRVKTVRFKF